MEIKDILREFPSLRWFRSGIRSLRRRNVDRRNADIICVYDAHRIFAPYARKLISQIRSGIEYLIPSDSIIVSDLHFNMDRKNQSSLAGFHAICWRFCTGSLVWATLYSSAVMSNRDDVGPESGAVEDRRGRSEALGLKNSSLLYVIIYITLFRTIHKW